MLETLVSCYKKVELFWKPECLSIAGNNLADQAANSAALKPVADVRITFDEGNKAQLRKLVFEEW